MINERYLIDINQKLEHILSIIQELVRVNSEINSNIQNFVKKIEDKKIIKRKKKK